MKNSITTEEIAALRSVQRKCYQQAYDSGWHTDPKRKERQEVLTHYIGFVLSRQDVDEILDHPSFSGKREFGTRLALAHSELSEALEGVRKNLNDSHLPDRPMGEVELADAIIRLFDTATVEGWDLAGALARKQDYNAVREDHKLEARALANGKTF